MVAAADATADSTMYREYVINQIQPITAWGRCYLTLDPHPLTSLGQRKRVESNQWNQSSQATAIYLRTSTINRQLSAWQHGMVHIQGFPLFCPYHYSICPFRNLTYNNDFKFVRPFFQFGVCFRNLTTYHYCFVKFNKHSILSTYCLHDDSK